MGLLFSAFFAKRAYYSVLTIACARNDAFCFVCRALLLFCARAGKAAIHKTYVVTSPAEHVGYRIYQSVLIL